MAAGKYKLLCLENPLLDLQAKGDQSLLDKYGLKNNDAILASDNHKPIYEELLSKYNAKIIPGGAAQNTARGAQYILPPSSVVYFGAVGKDQYAEMLLKACKEAGLDVEYHYDDKEPTGRCGVVITGHDRSMVTDLAAANCYKIEHLKSHWNLVQGASVYFVGGYHLTVCVPAVLALAEEAAKENKIFSFSLSAPFIPQFFKDQVDQVVPYADYLIGNETEALSYAESHGIESKDIATIAEKMANVEKKNEKRKRVVIITQGTDPTIVAVQGEGKPKTIPVKEISKSDIVDTNGAGDAFAGGFMAAVVQGEGLEKAVDMGQWLAKLSLTQLGPAYPFPKQTYSA
ncbi:Adenosine kinase [Sphaceloma murrayae]|uniref:Adenosine kinase n=1 Tax=Sphaceloma murrayae TaxID=2082308 RepID=A0A2K1QT48_9PEZI|nr:Adenosine kinase [Sphaceloma murrayae]